MYQSELYEPTGNLNPLTQCFRCGFSIEATATKKGVLLFNIGNEDISETYSVLRYGPDFMETHDVDTDINEEDLYGQPIQTCSINCAADTLSHLYKNDPEQFTVHIILMSAIYNVAIPGLPQTENNPKEYILKKEYLNNNHFNLKRWGGTFTYAEYRKHFICPEANIFDYSSKDNNKYEIVDQSQNQDDDDDEEEILGKKLPEHDDDEPTDPNQHYDLLAELEVMNVHDTEPVEDGEFDYLPPNIKKDMENISSRNNDITDL